MLGYASKPEDVALMAIQDAGYSSFRELAMRAAELPELISGDDEVIAGKLGLDVEVWRRLQTLDAYRQEQNVALIYKNVANPLVLQRVVAKLVQVAQDPEDEANGLAAQRLYYSLLARVGGLPKEESRSINQGMQVNIMMNHPGRQEVVTIGGARTGEIASGAGNAVDTSSHEA